MKNIQSIGDFINESEVNERKSASNIQKTWKNSDTVMEDMEDYLEQVYKAGEYDHMDDLKNTFKVLSKLAADYLKHMK